MSLTLRYHLRIYRREHLGLPVGLWALFAIIIAIMRDEPGRLYDMARAFLVFVLPLSAGILSASAIVDDTAMELQLAAPRAPWRILLERLAVLLAVVALGAATFQVYLAVMGVDISSLGNLAVRQLVWLVPGITLMGLSSLAALGLVQGTAGALAAGIVWLLQLLLKDWFIASPWARYLLLFLGGLRPGTPYLPWNQLCLTGLAVAFTVAASLLLRNSGADRLLNS